MLTQVNGTNPPAGEPINIVLSNLSDAAVLNDTEINGGFRNYFLSLDFAAECLGQHAGADQGVNLGDGNGYLPETAVLRLDYGNPALGTCSETIQGGNHIRYWVQNGPEANTGAFFIAASYELPIALGHNIIQDGYDLGRDWLIGNATSQKSVIDTPKLTEGSTFEGNTSFGGYTYHTNATYVTGILQNTSIGINHNTTVPINGRNAIDGLVAVVTVKIVGKPSSSATWSASSPRTWQLLSFFVILGGIHM